MKFFEETWKTSQQQTKFKHGNFNENHPKPFKKCLVTYELLQNFPAFQLVNTRVGFFTKVKAPTKKNTNLNWDERTFYVFGVKQENAVLVSNADFQSNLKISRERFQIFLATLTKFPFTIPSLGAMTSKFLLAITFLWL